MMEAEPFSSGPCTPRIAKRDLFGGVYLMYISDTVKEVPRPYWGKSMEIDAKEVHQSMNPGDGLIKRLDVVGESREDPRPGNRTPAIRGVELRAAVFRVSSGRFRAVLEIRNTARRLFR